jgi:Na+-driven multidrug efflux pump
MSLIPVLVTLPLPVLSAILYDRIRRKPEESFHLMSLHSADVKIAFQLFSFGFVALIALAVSQVLDVGVSTVSSVAGTAVTTSLAIALLILNVAARPPGGLHDYLPGRRRERKGST